MFRDISGPLLVFFFFFKTVVTNSIWYYSFENTCSVRIIVGILNGLQLGLQGSVFLCVQSSPRNCPVGKRMALGRLLWREPPFVHALEHTGVYSANPTSTQRTVKGCGPAHILQ